MIEARLERPLIDGHLHNVLHSILFIQALKKAGVPIIGNIVMAGVERGSLTMYQEDDLDGDIIVVRWLDAGESVSGAKHKHDFGSGKGFTWVRYEDHPLKSPATVKPDPDDWDEDDL